MRLNKSYKYADTTNAKAGVVVEEDFNKLSQRKCENNSLFYPVKNQEDREAKISMLIKIIQKQAIQIENLTKIVNEKNKAQDIIQSREFNMNNSENEENILKNKNPSPENKKQKWTKGNKGYTNQTTKIGSPFDRSIEEAKLLQSTNYDFTDNQLCDSKMQNIFYESNYDDSDQMKEYNNFRKFKSHK